MTQIRLLTRNLQEKIMAGNNAFYGGRRFTYALSIPFRSVPSTRITSSPLRQMSSTLPWIMALTIPPSLSAQRRKSARISKSKEPDGHAARLLLLLR